jgi:hypothetical protein
MTTTSSSGERPGRMLDRAFAAGAALTVGAAAALGMFVLTIAHGYAAAHSPSVVSGNSDDGFHDGVGNGGSVVAAPNGQAPVGGSHGS